MLQVGRTARHAYKTEGGEVRVRGQGKGRDREGGERGEERYRKERGEREGIGEKTR